MSGIADSVLDGSTPSTDVKMPVPEGRSLLAFGLVLLAASATAIGSSAVFYPSLAQLATARILGASLGFASGVMLYVSLVDIYSKAIDGFQEHGHSEDCAFIYTTLSFFGGIVFMKMIDMIIKRFTMKDEYEIEAGTMEDLVARNEGRTEQVPQEVGDYDVTPERQHSSQQNGSGNSASFRTAKSHEVEPQLPSHVTTTNYNQDDIMNDSTSSSSSSWVHRHPLSDKPVVNNIPPVSEVLEFVENGFVSTTRTEPTTTSSQDPTYNSSVGRIQYPTNNVNGSEDEIIHSQWHQPRPKDNSYASPQLSRQQQSYAPFNGQAHQTTGTSTELVSVGAATATAIALHNFPEGLVTFVAFVENPAVGIALAISIAIHNIPEGLCVAMAIYYGTGVRWKGFVWGTICCFCSEPAGALFGWVILGNNVFSGETYGILYGMVAGMMVFICLDELLPMAFKFDPRGTIVTWTCLAGMMLVAISLVLFKTVF